MIPNIAHSETKMSSPRPIEIDEYADPSKPYASRVRPLEQCIPTLGQWVSCSSNKIYKNRKKLESMIEEVYTKVQGGESLD